MHVHGSAVRFLLVGHRTIRKERTMNPSDERSTHNDNMQENIDEALVPAVTAPTKKKGRGKLIVLLSLAAVLTVALILAAVLFLPLLRRDTVTPVLERALMSDGELWQVLEELEEKGGESEAEICLPGSFLGVEEDISLSVSSTALPRDDGTMDGSAGIRITKGDYIQELQLVKNGDILAAKGLLSSDFLTLDLADAENELDDSILRPGSGTYALDADTYEQLIELLQELREPYDTQALETDAAVLEEAFERICSNCKDILRPKVKISWRARGFGLRKTETVTLEPSNLVMLLDEIYEELKRNDALSEMLDKIQYTDEYGNERTLLETVKKEIARMIREKQDLGTAILTIDSENGLATQVKVVYRMGNVTTTVYTRLMTTGLLLTLTTDERITQTSFQPTLPGAGISVEYLVRTQFSLNFGRYESGKSTRYVLELGITAEARHNSNTLAKESQSVKCELQYQHSNGAYQLRITGEDPILCAEGVCRINKWADTLSFTVTDLRWQDISIYESEPLVYLAADDGASAPLLRLECRAKKQPAVSTPTGRSIATLTVAEADAFSEGLPLTELAAWMEQFERTQTLKSASFELTLDFYYLSDEIAAMIKARYYEPYCKYVRRAIIAGEEPLSLLLYDEEMGLEMEVTYSLTKGVCFSSPYSYVVSMRSHNPLDTFTHAHLDAEGNITPHDMQLVVYQEATCEMAEYGEYACPQCAYVLKFRSGPLRHDFLYLNERVSPFTNALGETLTFSAERCKRCDRVDRIGFGNMIVSLKQQENGTYLIDHYYCSKETDDYHYLPEVSLYYLSIKGFTEDAGYNHIENFTGILETPSYFTTLKSGWPYAKCPGLQALVLPATLREVESGAFHADMVPKCIYFRGTAEQWAAVELNEYREAWQDVPVIFVTDGITRAEIRAQIHAAD